MPVCWYVQLAPNEEGQLINLNDDISWYSVKVDIVDHYVNALPNSVKEQLTLLFEKIREIPQRVIEITNTKKERDAKLQYARTQHYKSIKYLNHEVYGESVLVPLSHCTLEQLKEIKKILKTEEE